MSKRYKLKPKDYSKFHTIQWIKFDRVDEALKALNKLNIDYLEGKQFKKIYIIGVLPLNIEKVVNMLGIYNVELVKNNRASI